MADADTLDGAIGVLHKQFVEKEQSSPRLVASGDAGRSPLR